MTSRKMKKLAFSVKTKFSIQSNQIYFLSPLKCKLPAFLQ